MFTKFQRNFLSLFRFMKDLVLRTEQSERVNSLDTSRYFKCWAHQAYHHSPVFSDRSFFGSWRENGWFKMSRKYTGNKGQATAVKIQMQKYVATRRSTCAQKVTLVVHININYSGFYSGLTWCNNMQDVFKVLPSFLRACQPCENDHLTAYEASQLGKA